MSMNGQGHELMAQAEKKLGGWSIFNTYKYDDAAELYRKAGAQFKITKEWDHAGEAFAKAAEIFVNKCKNHADGVSCFGEAGRAYAQCEPKKAIQYLVKAATMQMNENRFSPAAKFFAEIGALYADKIGDRENAIKAYQSAADCYYNSQSTTTAHGFLIKICDLYIELKKYDEAITMWEKICDETPSTLSSRIEDICYKCILVTFVKDSQSERTVSINNTLEKYDYYINKYPRVEDSNKVKLVHTLAEAYSNLDEPLFTDALHKYDRIYKLDTFSMNMIYIIKTNLVRHQNNAVLDDAPIAITNEDELF